MSVNDKNIGSNMGVDVHPGVANPTTHSVNSNPLETNFVTDPATEDTGAGAGSNFEGHKQAQRNFAANSGVVEGRPGIIESTNIDPLNESSNKDDGWANANANATSTAPGIKDRAWNFADGVSNLAYGVATGDQSSTQQGKDALGLGKK
ncbi:hypothetical protein CONPUDRAFT_47767 [Coniophora puteana RWD-64-598 SS2]|uniref:Uncharacterized protein n=1 Tax=Coniophora puteana (strain RWD-64-598) TaxID=741705 RepID=A0A5M3N279_CONPW|nr:uncharacterized protein CONPUDRAFT_47767 [Coniophora puteana RWD-64-598 SS2]EIW85001.1 hypothetical protein CONPUDRAFT_47767 [Coniophora puteana RWD-64-598 SS2]